MPSISWPRTLTPQEQQELAAQRIACSFLVRGCETAIFDFRFSAAEAKGAEEAQTQQRAAEILQEVLGSWRETLAILRGVDVNQGWPYRRSLDDWLQVDPALLDDASSLARAASQAGLQSVNYR